MAQPIADDAVLRGLRTVRGIEPPSRRAGAPIVLAAPVPARPLRADRPAGRGRHRFRAPDRVAALLDGDPETSWTTAGPQRDDWIDVVLPQVARLGRIELRVPGRGRLYGRNLHLSVAAADGSAHSRGGGGGPAADRARSDRGRAPGPAVRTGRSPAGCGSPRWPRPGKPWAVAEMRIDRRLDEPAEAEVIPSNDP